MPNTDARSDPDNGLLDSVESEGDGIGPTIGPDVSPEHARRAIERGVFARRTARDQEAEGGAGEARSFEADGQDLTGDSLRGVEAGAAGDGAGASLGEARNSPIGAATPSGIGGANEQAGARQAHGQAQGGEAVAPDQTRAQGTAGSINDTEGA